MTDQIRGMSGAMGADAYRDFEQHNTQAMHIANDTDWPFSDVDNRLARRIVAGEYIGRHEGPLDEPENPIVSMPDLIITDEKSGRYAKAAAPEGVPPDLVEFVDPQMYVEVDRGNFAFAKRRHLRQAQQRILSAVRRSQPDG